VANDSPTPHSGSYDLAVTDGGYQALALERPDFNTSPYASLSFGSMAAARVARKWSSYGLLDGANQTAYPLVGLTANTWRQYIISLASLGWRANRISTAFGFKATAARRSPRFTWMTSNSSLPPRRRWSIWA